MTTRPWTMGDLRDWVGEREHIPDDYPVAAHLPPFPRRWARGASVYTNDLLGLHVDDPEDFEWAAQPGGGESAMLPEPPDGTRLEFEHHTDVYAAWRSDAESRRAGWPVGDGGRVWCIYGHSVPRTWHWMLAEFGDSLKTAVRLQPHPEDVHMYEQWPTQVWLARQEGKTDEDE